jgi:hypothetical protein
VVIQTFTKAQDMRLRSYQSISAAYASESSGGGGGGGGLISTTSVNVGSYGNYSGKIPERMIDGSGLSGSDSSATHDMNGNNNWSSDFHTSGVGFTIRFGFGTPRTISNFYFWPATPSAGGAAALQCPQNFALNLYAADGTTLLRNVPGLTIPLPVEGSPSTAIAFNFTSTSGVYFADMAISSNHGSNYTTIAEVSFGGF